jgi:hypothetical protein
MTIINRSDEFPIFHPSDRVSAQWSAAQAQGSGVVASPFRPRPVGSLPALQAYTAQLREGVTLEVAPRGDGGAQLTLKVLDATGQLETTQISLSREQTLSLRAAGVLPDDASQAAQYAKFFGGGGGGPGDPPSVWESMFRGAMQGLTFGASDEIEAAFKTAFVGGTYKDNVRGIRAEYKAAREAHPVAYFAGDVIGSALTSTATVYIKGVQAAVRATTYYNYAKRGAKIGAINGYMRSEKEDLKGQLEDTVKGAAIGAGTAVVVGPVINAAAQAAKKGVQKVVEVTQRELRRRTSKSSSQTTTGTTSAQSSSQGGGSNGTSSSSSGGATGSGRDQLTPSPTGGGISPRGDVASATEELVEGAATETAIETPPPIESAPSVERIPVLTQRQLGGHSKLGPIIDDICRSA